MLKDQIRELFHRFDPSVQLLISEVIDLEQRNISMERPRLQKDLDDLVSRIAKQELDKEQPAHTEE